MTNKTVNTDNNSIRVRKRHSGMFKKNDPVTGEKDPRINRRGRLVSNAAALEKEIKGILAEIMLDEKGRPIVDDVSGEKLTRLRARLRVASSSRGREFWDLLAHAYGKPRERVDVEGKQEITLRVIYQDKPTK